MNQPFEALYIGCIKNCKSVPCVPSLVFAKEKELSLVERFHILSVILFFSDFTAFRLSRSRDFCEVTRYLQIKEEPDRNILHFASADPASYAISCAQYICHTSCGDATDFTPININSLVGWMSLVTGTLQHAKESPSF